jgi:hypothetical protein
MRAILRIRQLLASPGLKSQGECESLAYRIIKGAGARSHCDYGCWPYRAAITDGRKPYGKEPDPNARWFEWGCPMAKRPFMRSICYLLFPAIELGEGEEDVAESKPRRAI